jgi:hypothetical protein
MQKNAVPIVSIVTLVLSETRTAFKKVVKSLRKVVRISLRIRLLHERVRLISRAYKADRRLYQAKSSVSYGKGHHVLRITPSLVTAKESPSPNLDSAIRED